MSKDPARRRAVIDEVSREIAELQEATERVDEAAVASLGVNTTDRRCLWALFSRGPLSAGDLARASGLSAGATTTAIDRLERAGYARRTRASSDRRSVTVELTDEARHQIDELYGPIGDEGRARLERYTDRQLILLRDFLREARALQVEHAARIRGAWRDS